MPLFNPSDHSVLKRFAANTGWLVAQNVFQYVLSAVIGILAARYMGPSNYGILGYGAAMMTLFSPLCTLGVNDVLIPCMVDEPEDAGKLIGTALVMRLTSTVLSIGALLLLVSLMKPGQTLLLLVTALQSLQLIIQACDVFRLWFQMKLLSKYTAIGSVIGNVACSAWRIVLLIQGATVEWFALTSVIQMLASYLFVLPMFAKVAHIRLSVSKEALTRLWRRGYQLILADLTVVIANRIGAVMLSNMLGDTPLGIYNAALNITMMWQFVPQALVDSANPVLMQTNRNNPEQFWPRYQALLMAVLVVCTAAGAGICLLSPWIVDLLYGPKYMGAVPILRLLAFIGIFTSIGTARNIWTMAKNKQRYVKYFCMVSAAASITFNFVFIRLLGAMGAALGILLVNVVQSLIAPLLFSESREFVVNYFRAFRQLPEAMEWLRGLLKRKGGSHHGDSDSSDQQ